MLLAWEQLNGRSGHDVGRQLLQQLWQTHRGGEMPEIAVTDRGKPYFVGSDVHFSISHCKNHAFCCLSDRPVGLDAEEIDREIRLELAEKILSESEYRRWKESDDPRLTLLKFWVLKEAAAKASGRGLGNSLRRTDLDPEKVQTIDGCLVAIEERNDLDAF